MKFLNSKDPKEIKREHEESVTWILSFIQEVIRFFYIYTVSHMELNILRAIWGILTRPMYDQYIRKQNTESQITINFLWGGRKD